MEILPKELLQDHLPLPEFTLLPLHLLINLENLLKDSLLLQLVKKLEESLQLDPYRRLQLLIKFNLSMISLLYNYNKPKLIKTYSLL